MKAVVLKDVDVIELTNVPAPGKASPGHLIIKMQACAINSGDKLFISGAFPRGIPASKYNIAGVSGVGKVLGAGPGVPAYYVNENVTVYRSLKYSEETMGTWSEYAHLHYLNCAVIPQNLDPIAYSGSLVNIITPYSFLEKAISEGQNGIICTAGNSATGIVLLGLCLLRNFPIVSIVRTEKGKRELEALGASIVLVQTDPKFEQQLREVAEELKITLVFDGVGGATLSNIISVLPFNTTVYCYGFLDKQTPVRFSTTTLMRGITITGFSNFRTPTVQNEDNLEKALRYITSIIDQPCFKTKLGMCFGLDNVGEALRVSLPAGNKSVLVF
jgi:NADPH:quinone reductase